MCKRITQDDSYYNSCYIVGDSKDGEWLIFEDYLGGLQQHHKKDGEFIFRPADTRTDKERAISDLRKNTNPFNILESVLKAIASGEIHCVKWVGKS